MKKLLLILLCLPMIGFGQKTYVPCDAFESFLESLGYGDYQSNDSVYTDSIRSILDLHIVDNFGGPAILYCSNLIGIEDFDSLKTIIIGGNVNNIDLSNNHNLINVYISYNDSLVNLDITNLSNLTSLKLSTSPNSTMPLNSIDLSTNTSLEYLQISCSPWPQTLGLPNQSQCNFDQGAVSLTQLDISNNFNLKSLSISNTLITSLDASNLSLLEYANINQNYQLINLNLSNNQSLSQINCVDNNIEEIDIINNINLERFHCLGNNIACLDFSSLSSLSYFDCRDNLLDKLILTSPNWMNMYGDASTNLLTCVEVDNVLYATTHFTIDTFTSFSTNCNYTNTCSSSTAIQEQTTNKELLKVTDLLGRETKGTKNEVLFYIYDDGTVEKRIVIE